MPGSSSSTDPRFHVGRLGRPHGLDGWIGLYVDESDVVYFDPGNTVLVDSVEYEVSAIRRADRGHHLKLAGVDDREEAEEIRGTDIFVTNRRSLDEDEFWPEDLVGLEVRDPEGRKLGTVVSLVTGGAQDRLVVDTGDSRSEVPFVAELVPDIDITAGFLTVAAIPGLIGQ